MHGTELFVFPVTTGLDPVVYADLQDQDLTASLSIVSAAWIAGSSPAMTTVIYAIAA